MSHLSSLTLGHLDSRQHEAAAAAVLRVLEAHEMEVTLFAAGRDDLKRELAAGRIDLLATAWLPDVDADLPGTAAEPLGGILYRPFLLWAVPAAAALPELDSIADLANEQLAEALDRRLVVPDLLADAAARVIEAYGLADAGWHLEVAADDETAFEHAAALLDADKAAVLPLWQPHALAHGGRLRVLADPLAVLGGPQDARLLLRHGLRARLDPDLLDELDELTLGNPVVSAMEHAMRRDNMSADEAAEAWQRGRLTPRA